MSEVEFSDHVRSSSFPASWGRPPGTPMSEERARWVAANVERYNRRPEVRLRQLDRVKWAESDQALTRALDARDRANARTGTTRNGTTVRTSTDDRESAAMLRRIADALERQ